MEKLVGVYQVINLINSKRYVGSSRNLYNRRKHHFSSLKIHSKTANKPLQEDYDIFGVKNFVFHVLEKCDPDISKADLIYREQYWIDKLKPVYNVNEIAGSYLNSSAFTAEAKKKKYAKISSSLKGRKRNITWKTGPKFLTDEQKQHLSEINTGEKNPNFGLKRSKETRAKMSAKAAKTYDGALSPDGIIYAPIHNMREFCKQHPELKESGMIALMHGKRNTYKGWTRYEGK